MIEGKAKESCRVEDNHIGIRDSHCKTSISFPAVMYLLSFDALERDILTMNRF